MMQALLKRLNSKKRGFTLIELIIVIAILAILAAILVPSMLKIVNDSRDRVLETNARSAYQAAQQAFVSIKAEPTLMQNGETDQTAIERIAKENLGDAFAGTITVTLYEASDAKEGIKSVTYTDTNGKSATYSPDSAGTGDDDGNG